MTTNRAPVVLLVGGWSPGPLVYLESVLAERRCTVIQPKNLPMPPFPGSWCWHPSVLLMVVICGLLLWIATMEHENVIWKILPVLGLVAWIRIFVAVVVRASIQTSMKSCLEAARQHDGNIVLLGFSWGGAVIAELLAQRKFGSQPVALLVAPTTSLVASIAMGKDAARRIDYGDDAAVHVVHGTADLAFCPNQDRFTAGVRLHRIQDNHIFLRHSSQIYLGNLLSQQLDTAAIV